MMNKQNWLVLCAILALAVMPLSVNAFGITAAYYPGNPLTLQPGETRTLAFGLSNNAGEPENLTVVAEITKGAEIAQLAEPGKQYDVPFGTSNNIGINFIVTAPTEDPVGKTYEVEIMVTTVTPGTGGGVVLGQSIGAAIPIVIVSPTGEITPKKQFPVELVILLVLAVLLIIAIIIVILGMKKKKRQQSKN